MARALTETEILEVGAMSGRKRTPGAAARFTANGGGFDVMTGVQHPRGVNVIYLPVVWDVSRAQAKRIAELTGTNLEYQSPT